MQDKGEAEDPNKVEGDKQAKALDAFRGIAIQQAQWCFLYLWEDGLYLVNAWRLGTLDPREYFAPGSLNRGRYSLGNSGYDGWSMGLFHVKVTVGFRQTLGRLYRQQGVFVGGGIIVVSLRGRNGYLIIVPSRHVGDCPGCSRALSRMLGVLNVKYLNPLDPVQRRLGDDACSMLCHAASETTYTRGATRI